LWRKSHKDRSEIIREIPHHEIILERDYGESVRKVGGEIHSRAENSGWIEKKELFRGLRKRNFFED
jgi:hypothetical protein